MGGCPRGMILEVMTEVKPDRWAPVNGVMGGCGVFAPGRNNNDDDGREMRREEEKEERDLVCV